VLYLKPKPGAIVRRPDGKLLPERGAHVPNNTFWRRRLKAGDCVECKPPNARHAKPAPDDKTIERSVDSN
jgi:Protein of unknown function (DUF2635)